MSEFTSENFQGWLLKFGTQEFPHELIKQATWKTTPNQRLENDAWTDNSGYLMRDTMPHTRTKIEFETVDDLTLDEKIKIQSIMSSSVVNKNQRKANITYWNDEDNEYKSATIYVPDTDFTINEIDKRRNEIYYASIKITLIEY